jgi:hypothetical protein
MEANMVANKLAGLSDAELALIEKLLRKEFLEETDRHKTWKTKNLYEKPYEKSQHLARCITAIKSQRDLNRMMETRW